MSGIKRIIPFVAGMSLLIALNACHDEESSTSGGTSGGEATDNVSASAHTDNLSDLVIALNSASLSETEDAASISNTDKVELQTFASETIRIVWNGGSSPTVTGSVSGVSVDATSSDVTVTSNSGEKVVYELSGSGSGSFTMESTTEAFEMRLNGLELTSTANSPINNQSKKLAYVSLTGNSVLTDGTTSNAKGVVFSKGALVFSGDGTLKINSNYDTGIKSSKSYVRFRPGVNIEIACNGQGHGVKAETDVTIGGGVLNISIASSDSAGKGISSNGTLNVYGGRTTVINNALAYYDEEEADCSAGAGLKADGELKIYGGEVDLKSSGAGGKGMSCDTMITITGGTINIITEGAPYVYDAANDIDTNPKGIKGDSGVVITGGKIAVRCDYQGDGSEGIESKKQLSISGGLIEVYSGDDALNSAGDMTISGGQIYARSTTNDAIDSNGNIYLNGGVVVAVAASYETGIDAAEQHYIYVNGGTIVAIGGSMLSSIGSSSKQASLYHGGIGQNTLYALNNADGTNLLAYKTPSPYSNGVLLLSASGMKSGSTYTMLTGATVSGGTDFHGLILGGTIAANGSESSITLSGASTTVGVSGGGMPGGMPGGGKPGGM